MLGLKFPDGSSVEGQRVLLHACCAPCSSAVVECMLQNGIRPMVFFCNPNIFPLEEYVVRREELKGYLRRLSVPYVEDEYDHVLWQSCVRGLEGEPERGGRCLLCFGLRLERTARRAAQEGVRWFTTTLSSSRWKDFAQICLAGRQAEAACPGTAFWAQNWRKGGLQQRRAELLRSEGFYNQQYCGCEYGLAAMKNKLSQQENKILQE